VLLVADSYEILYTPSVKVIQYNNELKFYKLLMQIVNILFYNLYLVFSLIIAFGDGFY